MDIDLEELELLHKAATPGPWVANNWGRVWYTPNPDRKRLVCDTMRNTVRNPKSWRANARLIAAMRNAVPSLIARIRELERQRAEAISYILSNEGASMIDCRICFFVSSCECEPKQCAPNRELCERAVRKAIEEAGE